MGSLQTRWHTFMNTGRLCGMEHTWSGQSDTRIHTITWIPPLSPEKIQAYFTTFFFSFNLRSITLASPVKMNMLFHLHTAPPPPILLLLLPLKLNLLTVYANGSAQTCWTRTVCSHGKALGRNDVIPKRQLEMLCKQYSDCCQMGRQHSACQLLGFVYCETYLSCLCPRRLIWLFAGNHLCLWGWWTELRGPQGCHISHCKEVRVFWIIETLQM